MFDIFTPRSKAKQFLYALRDEEPGVLLCSFFKELSLILEMVRPVAMLQRGEGRAAPHQTARDKDSDECQGDQNPAEQLHIMIRKKTESINIANIWETPMFGEVPTKLRLKM